MMGGSVQGKMGAVDSGVLDPLPLVLPKGIAPYDSLSAIAYQSRTDQRWREVLSMDLTDEQLVKRALRNELWAFEELVRRHHGKVHSIAHHMCEGDPEEASDMTQEAFLRAFRNLRKFRGESSFYTWLYRIVVNTCLDGRRKRKRWEQMLSVSRSSQSNEEGSEEPMAMEPDTSVDSNPLEVLSGKQLSGRLRRAMAALPDRQRVAFQLKVLHGMSIKEISQVMGAAEGTVKSHLFRATRSLQEAMKDWK